MALDTVTLVFCTSLVEALLVAALLLFRARQETCDGFTQWTASVIAVMAMGAVLLVRPVTPLGLNVALSNALGVWSTLLRLDGTIRFVAHGRSLDRHWYLLAPLVALAVSVLPGPDQAPLRALVSALAGVPAIWMTAGFFWSNEWPRGNSICRVAGGILVAFGLLACVRTAWWLFHPQAAMLAPAPINVAFFAALPLFEVSMAIVFLMLNSQHLEREARAALQELEQSMAQVKVLQGLLPICSHCKNIRDEQGDWHRIETYVRDHSHADFSHGICPACVEQLYPDMAQRVLDKSTGTTQ